MTTGLDVKRATEVRRLALQMLYQFDARQGRDEEEIRQSLLDAASDAARRYEGRWQVRAPADPHEHQEAFEKARHAWAGRDVADKLASSLAPEWPTHRQPMLDRAIIRLCWFEMTAGHIPPKVAINEAIELAKQFGTERSAVFLNGVIDKMLKHALEQAIIAPLAPQTPAESSAAASTSSSSPSTAGPSSGALAAEAHFPMQHKGGADESAAVDFWSSDH